MRFLNAVNLFLAESCGCLLGLMVVFLSFEIFVRTLGIAIMGGAELAVFSMIIAVYFGLPIAEEQDRHVRVNTFVEMLPPRVQRIIDIFVYLVMAVTLMVVCYAVLSDLIYAVTENQATGGAILIPLWPPKLLLCLGVFFYWMQILRSLMLKLGWTKGQPAAGT